MTMVQQNEPVVIRSKVEKKSNFRDYREYLRFDFWYSCAYCSLSESEACGIGFEIDHYSPVEHFPSLKNDYNNLMWSCEKCNGFKLDYYPEKDDEDRGNIIIRPDNDDPREHLELRDYRLIEKTNTGKFNIEKLYLNRKTLRLIRRIRERYYEAADFIAFGVNRILSLHLDLVPNIKNRILLSEMRKIVAEKYYEIGQNIDGIIMSYARSPLLDIDPEKNQDLKRRREFLKEQRSLNSDAPFVMKKKKAKK